MTACAAPRHDGQAEPTEAAAHATLCRPCTYGLARDLRLAARYHAELGELLPGGAAGHGDGTGLPFHEPAAECRDQIRRDLTWWCVEITGLRGLDAPPVLLPGWADHPVPVMAGWLHGQVTWASFRGFAPDMAGAISDDRRRAAALLDPRVVRRFVIPGRDGICLACGEGRIEATVFGEDDRRRPFIACLGCGERWLGEQWLKYGEAVIRRRESVA